MTNTLWTGSLPEPILPQRLADFWTAASHAVGLAPAVRIFSGPFPLPAEQPLIAQACPDGAIRRRTGAVVLTAMPAIHGGGAKEEKTLRAEAFAIAGGFFVNADASPTNILTSLMPRTTGVILLDHDVAKAAIGDMHPAGADEFAILVLGHTCPDAATCSMRVHFPAYTPKAKRATSFWWVVCTIWAKNMFAPPPNKWQTWRLRPWCVVPSWHTQMSGQRPGHGRTLWQALFAP